MAALLFAYKFRSLHDLCLSILSSVGLACIWDWVEFMNAAFITLCQLLFARGRYKA